MGFAGGASARPVSYPGGWTVLQFNDGATNSLWVHQSPTAHYSLGYYGQYDRASEDVHHTLRATRLVKRWNEKASQANLYAWGGLGVADPAGGAALEGVGHVGLSADWETRRWFVMGEAKAVQAGDAGEVEYLSRFGVAPYEGDYGDLHLWLMLQNQHKPTAEEAIVTTPMARLFWKVNLIEVGWQIQTETLMFNWIVRR